MIKKNIFKSIITIFIVFISFFSLKNAPNASADARCGDGYVCWESNGGEIGTYESCTFKEDKGYCSGTITRSTCECTSQFCDCTLPGYDTCNTNYDDVTYTCLCIITIDGEEFVDSACNAGTCSDPYAVPNYIASTGDSNCRKTTAKIGCCFGEAATPVPPGPTATPVPPGDPTPTPQSHFSGFIYDDVDAIVSGLGGTDNLCTGSTATSVGSSGATATVSRTGESTGLSISSSYFINTATTNSDYTVVLDLPFPPVDPQAAWQCACNADPADPYRCIYTNQTPTTGVEQTNFFIYQANLNNEAWWQTLGGHIYSETNIETNVPSVTCLAPDCTPALIGSDVDGVQDSAGFPTTNTGDITTTAIGETYIHEIDGRATSVQGQAQGVSLPTEDYAFFSSKMIGQAQTLSNATKPTPSTNPGIYLYTGDLTITEASPWNVSNSEQIIVFVNGNLIFDDTTNSETRLATVATGGTGYLQFIVSGNITVNPSVGYTSYTIDASLPNTALIEGIYIADGLFTVQGEALTTDRKFIGAGTFVGWSGIQLERNFDDSATPTYNNEDATETFIYRPDLLVNAPQIVKSAHITWQEVAPQWPGL